MCFQNMDNDQRPTYIVTSKDMLAILRSYAVCKSWYVLQFCAAAVIGFVETAVEVGEAAGPAILNVALLSGRLGKEVSVEFTTLDGTALG